MAYRKLGRNSSNRKALFRSILSSFFKHERIETTVTKAKEVSKHAAKLITLAKRGDLHARRLSSWTKKQRENCLTRSLLNTQTARAALPVFIKLVLAAVTLLKWQLSSSSDWYKQLT